MSGQAAFANTFGAEHNAEINIIIEASSYIPQ